MNEAFSRLLRRDTKTCAEAWFRRLKRPAERSRQVRTGTTRVQGEYPEGVKAMTDRNEFPDLETAAGLLFDPHIAYIKPTPVAEARRMGILPPGIRVPDNLKLYVLHASDGRVLGFTDDWDSAYSAAVQNELTPLSVH